MNFEWDNTYSVNNELIDAQHQKLLGLFDETYQLLSKKSYYKTMELISELSVYAVFHFTEEESLMKKAHFEGLEDHQAKHGIFIEKISQFKNDALNNVEDINEEIFLFLADWILTHIQETDRLYMDAIKNIN